MEAIETLQVQEPELEIEFQVEDPKPKQKTRVIYLDILRVLSIICVITLHTVAGKVADMTSIGQASWWWACALNGMLRWAVPVFFMISGVLTLDKPDLDNLPRFLKTRLVKIGIPFLIWSVIYSFIKEIYVLQHAISFPNILGTILSNIFLDQSYYHLWFVYDIFILYLISPLLKKIIVNATKKEFEYWIGLWFVVTVLYTCLQQVMMFIGQQQYFYVHILNVPFAFGLSGYYILGYYLHRYDLPKKLRMIVYIGSLISVAVTIFGTYALSISKNVLNESFYSHFSITTAFISVAAFIFMKRINWKKRLTESFQNFIVILSNATFGIYLVHLAVTLYLASKLSFLLSTSYALYTITIIVGTFVLSFFIVKLLQLIPFVGKYLF